MMELIFGVWWIHLIAMIGCGYVAYCRIKYLDDITRNIEDYMRNHNGWNITGVVFTLLLFLVGTIYLFIAFVLNVNFV